MRILADFDGKTEIVDVEPFDSMYSLKLKVLSAMFNLRAHEKDRFVQSAMLHSKGADLDAETLEPKNKQSWGFQIQQTSNHQQLGQ